MHAPWQLHAHQAQLHLGQLVARVDLSDPSSGLTQLRFAGKDFDGNASSPRAHLLAVGLSAAGESERGFVEGYVRGTDLIATYRETPEQPLRRQVYWRVQACYRDALAAVEMVISVQTRLLDSQPQLTTSTLLPAASGWRWRSCEPGCEQWDALACPPPARWQFDAANGIGCFRFQLAGADIDYVEMVHPADFDSTSLEAWPQHDAAANKTLLAHRLFAERLEKGVILRSRVLGLFLPRQSPPGTIAEYYRMFAAEELPLTT